MIDPSDWIEQLEKETLNQAELAEIFAPVEKRPAREVWLSSEQRSVSDRPPVQTDAEKESRGDEPIVPQDEGAARDEHPADPQGPVPDGGTVQL